MRERNLEKKLRKKIKQIKKDNDFLLDLIISLSLKVAGIKRFCGGVDDVANGDANGYVNNTLENKEIKINYEFGER